MKLYELMKILGEYSANTTIYIRRNQSDDVSYILEINDVLLDNDGDLNIGFCEDGKDA